MKTSSLSLFLKKIRLNNNDETLTEMAKRLNISTSYLSSVENEKRNMTDEIYRVICTLYELTPAQCDEFLYLKILASSRINVDLKSLEPDAKKTTVRFLSNVESLSEEDLARINKIINEKGK